MIAAGAGLAVAAVADPGATVDALTIAALVAMVGAPAAGAIATLYMLKVYREDQRRPRSWILRLAVIAGAVVTGVSGYIAFLAALRLSGELRSLPEIAILGLVVGIVALEGIPIAFALEVRRRRIGAKDRPSMDRRIETK